jgi:ectoine hydroxylase-related dioxygenase (phytanoyl-CoA dioxygenase family)
VQPPAPALEQVVAVRIDLDGSDAERGALRVLPGTHRLGILPPARVAELARTIEPVTCTVPVGGALSMRPLLLHASSRALQPSHRRIVHLEFAGQRLLGRDQDPAGLAFDDGVG